MCCGVTKRRNREIDRSTITATRQKLWRKWHSYRGWNQQPTVVGKGKVAFAYLAYVSYHHVHDTECSGRLYRQSSTQVFLQCHYNGRVQRVRLSQQAHWLPLSRSRVGFCSNCGLAAIFPVLFLFFRGKTAKGDRMKWMRMPTSKRRNEQLLSFWFIANNNSDRSMKRKSRLKPRRFEPDSDFRLIDAPRRLLWHEANKRKSLFHIRLEENIRNTMSSNFHYEFCASNWYFTVKWSN